jgi:putative aldouronate transport system permease protein
MDSLPNEYYEAARMDGAGHFYCMTKVILPLAGPFLGVTVMFSAIAHWNSWVEASYFIDAQHKNLYPLQLLLKDILMKSSIPGIKTPSGYPVAFYTDGIKAASVVVSSLPLLIIYPFIQKFFEKGIILGGVKG